jgi:ribosome modulation factor
MPNSVSAASTPYRDGYWAFAKEHKKESDCPSNLSKSEAEAWRAGWREARRDAARQQSDAMSDDTR